MSGHVVLCKFLDERHPVLVKEGMDSDRFTATCQRAFGNLPDDATVVGLLDDNNAFFRYDLLAAYPREFENAEYELVIEGQGSGGGGGADSANGSSAAGANPEFLVHFASADLGLTQADCDSLRSLVAASGLARMAFEDVHDVFARASSAGVDGTPVLNKDAFDACLNQLVPASAVEPRARDRVYAALVKAFYLFDRTEAQSVNFTEFVSGMSLFCSGRKSDKLGLAFRVFDTDDDGLLSRRELWRYLRSFLTVLFTLSETAGRERTEDLYVKIDDATVAAAQMVFAEAEANGQAGAVSFDTFGEWYNKGGFMLLPWLELLDLNKWPEGPADVEPSGDDDEPTAEEVQAEIDRVAATAGRGSGGSGDGDGDGGDDDERSEPALEFPLSDDGLALQIGVDDVEAYMLLLRASTLDEVSPTDMVREVLRRERDGALYAADFENAVETLTGTQQSMAVRRALMDIFKAFDYDGSNVVDSKAFLAGFLMLASGSKSDKLSLAFRLFDEDNDGYLSRREMWKYLRAFLTVLVALSDRYHDVPAHTVNSELIDTGAVEATATVFLQAEREHDDKASFTEFGTWYNHGGFVRMPWLELLDHSKWPATGADSEASSARRGSASSADASGAGGASGESGDDVSGPVFQFMLDNDGAVVLEFTERDVDDLMALVETSGLYNSTADAVQAAFANEADDGVLDKPAFDRAIRQLVPGGSLSSEEKQYLSFALSNLFFAFDRDNNNVVDADEFTAGFGMLVSGSKSDKLSLAFRLFDEDGDGYISVTEMWRYVRAFLTMLTSLNEGTRSLPPEKVNPMVATAARELTGRIFKDADLNEDRRISYEEFGRWYNRGGFEVMPWLELLDLSKWRVDDGSATGSAESGAGGDAGSAESGSAASGGARDKVVFEFVLSDSGDVFLITEDDVAYMHKVVQTSNLSSASIADVDAAFQKEARDGVLDKPAFDRVIRRLIPGRNLSKDDKAFLSFALSNVFWAFDRDGNGVVDYDEFVSGFSVLVSGSKSDKLSLAFRMFDEDGDGYINRLELWKYLRAFLTVLIALNEVAQRVPVADLQKLVNRSALELTKLIFNSADMNKDGLISYEEFGHWYNRGGFDVIPWLELLDLTKWPEAGAGSASASAAEDDGDDEDASGSADDGGATGGGGAAGGGGDDDGSTPVFEFPLSANSDDVLQITVADVRNMQRLTDTTGLDAIAPGDVHAAFQKKASNGYLGKKQFDSAIRSLVPGDRLTREDKEFLSFALSNVFFQFDREGTNEVEVNDFMAGFSLLASGSKSDKLSLAFRLFDSDSDGYLTRKELWEYLRAFLTVLVALNGEMMQVASKTVALVIDRNALDLTGRVFDSAQLRHVGKISYEEFGGWYNGGGFKSVPWLELLDLNKWPTPEDVEGGSAASSSAGMGDTTDGASASDADGGAASEQGDIVFEFKLGTDAASDQLEINRQDVANLRRVMAASRLPEVALDVLHRRFNAYAKDGSLDKPSFDKVVRELIPGDRLTREDKGFLSFALNNVFFAFDRDQNNRVSFDEFVAGFSLLAAGSKSDKLSLAFRLFDEDGDGYVSRREMWKYLRAFLTVLVSLKEISGDVAVTDPQVIDKAAMDLTATIMEDADTNKDGKISYEEFGQWYNVGGFELVPWLELLDLKKWPSVEALEGDDDDDDEEDDEDSSAGDVGDADDSRRAGDGGGDGDEDEDDDDGEDDDDDDDDDEDDDEDDDDEDDPLPVFEFQLSDSGDMLEITEADCDNVRMMRATAQLDRLSAEELQTEFQRESTSGLLDKTAFDRVVRSLVPGDKLSKDDKTFLSYALSNIYFAFDRDGEGVVGLDEFVAGFSLLASGSKSDKLSLAFRLFDEDNDGYISRREMWRYLRSFLTALMAITMMASDDDDTVMPTIVDRAAVELTGKVFESADLRADGRISYEEFGAWYNKGGFRVLPWLELLDLQKWPSPGAAH